MQKAESITTTEKAPVNKEQIFKPTGFDQSLNKLFEILDAIFQLKVKQAGQGSKSIVYINFIRFQKYFKLYGSQKIKPLFSEIFDKYQDRILADNLGFLETDQIVIKLPPNPEKPEKNPPYLSLSKFYNNCLSFGNSMVKLMIQEFQVCLYKIFYSLSLEFVTISGTSEAETIKKMQHTLLMLVKTKTPKQNTINNQNDATNATANILNGLIKGIDITKSTQNGNINGLVDKLVNNADSLMVEMGVDYRIPSAMKGKIVKTADLLTNTMEKNPNPSDVMKVATDALKPGIDTEEIDSYEPKITSEPPGNEKDTHKEDEKPDI